MRMMFGGGVVGPFGKLLRYPGSGAASTPARKALCAANALLLCEQQRQVHQSPQQPILDNTAKQRVHGLGRGLVGTEWHLRMTILSALMSNLVYFSDHLVTLQRQTIACSDSSKNSPASRQAQDGFSHLTNSCQTSTSTMQKRNGPLPHLDEAANKASTGSNSAPILRLSDWGIDETVNILMNDVKLAEGLSFQYQNAAQCHVCAKPFLLAGSVLADDEVADHNKDHDRMGQAIGEQAVPTYRPADPGSKHQETAPAPAKGDAVDTNNNSNNSNNDNKTVAFSPGLSDIHKQLEERFPQNPALIRHHCINCLQSMCSSCMKEDVAGIGKLCHHCLADVRSCSIKPTNRAPHTRYEDSLLPQEASSGPGLLAQKFPSSILSRIGSEGLANEVQYAIATLPSENCIILAFRGTDSKADFVIGNSTRHMDVTAGMSDKCFLLENSANLGNTNNTRGPVIATTADYHPSTQEEATTRPLHPIKFHGGITRQINTVYDEIVQALVDAVSQYPSSESTPTHPPSVVLTGHSLGGGYAACVGLRLLCDARVRNHITPAQLQVITYGSPRVLYEDTYTQLGLLSLSKDMFYFKNHFTNYVNDTDPIPRLLGTIYPAKLLAREILCSVSRGILRVHMEGSNVELNVERFSHIGNVVLLRAEHDDTAASLTVVPKEEEKELFTLWQPSTLLVHKYFAHKSGAYIRRAVAAWKTAKASPGSHAGSPGCAADENSVHPIHHPSITDVCSPPQARTNATNLFSGKLSEQGGPLPSSVSNVDLRQGMQQRVVQLLNTPALLAIRDSVGLGGEHASRLAASILSLVNLTKYPGLHIGLKDLNAMARDATHALVDSLKTSQAPATGNEATNATTAAELDEAMSESLHPSIVEYLRQYQGQKQQVAVVDGKQTDGDTSDDPPLLGLGFVRFIREQVQRDTLANRVNDFNEWYQFLAKRVIAAADASDAQPTGTDNKQPPEDGAEADVKRE